MADGLSEDGRRSKSFRRSSTAYAVIKAVLDEAEKAKKRVSYSI